MDKKLNPSQRQAVNAGGNTVVSAGAGSGKTTVLALRFLRLIREQKAGVEEILTLTFTKKAAAEMYRRIYGLLEECRDEAPVRQALLDFSMAPISTLDSFSSRIVKGDCGRFGIPLDFRTDPRETDDLIGEEALKFILANKNRPAMERLLDEYGFSRVREDFWGHLAKTSFSLVRPPDFSALAEIQIGKMDEDLKKRLEEIAGIIGAFGELDPAAGSMIKKGQEVFSALPDLRLLCRERRWADLSVCLEKTLAVKKTGGQKQDILLAKELVDDLRKEGTAALGCCVVLEQAAYIREIALLASEFQEQMGERKRGRAVLNFQDVAELAVEILKTNPALRRFFKSRFRYIMIDEFQDNNLLQKELLYLLAEKPGRETPGIPGPEDLDRNKLYFVGDGKQSIYRFRGADVSVFMGLAGELKKGGGESLVLSTNYRSAPELIAFFNKIFPPIMNGGESFEAVFEALESRPSAAEIPGVRPLIRLYYGGDQNLPEDCLGRQEAEAYTLARFVRDSVENKTLMVSSGEETRPAGYDDFALLLRSGGNQFYYERFFRNMGIPYTVGEPRSLFLEAPANDLSSFLKLLVYPEDRIALTAFLRSPFVNLSDDSLAAFLLKTPLAEPAGSGEKELFYPAGEELMLREEDRRKYRRAGEMYRTCLALADRIPHRELISRLWYDWGYSCFLLRQPSYHHYLEYFDFFFALAGEADSRGLSLSSFLDELSPLLGEGEKLPELKVMRREGGGVKIMTVHASKGLEFPVMILADCGNSGRRASPGGAPCFYSPETGISLRLGKAGPEEDEDGRREGSGTGGSSKKSVTNPVYNRIREDEEARELAELKRLLYVALTRAESHLILAGYHHRNNQSGFNNLLNLFLSAFGWQPKTDPKDLPELAPYLDFIEPVPREQSLKSYRFRKEISPEKAFGELSRRNIRERKIEKRELGVTEYLSLFSGSGFDAPGEVLPALEIDELISRREWEGLFGTLCHLLLEEEVKGLRQDIRRDRLLAGLEDKEAAALVREAERLRDHFFQSDLGRQIKGHVSPADGRPVLESELSFLLKKESSSGESWFLRGQIDLLIRVRPAGEIPEEIWLVDFKTGKEKKPEAHRAQLAIYQEAVIKMENARSRTPVVRCFVCYLRDASVIEI